MYKNSNRHYNWFSLVFSNVAGRISLALSPEKAIELMETCKEAPNGRVIAFYVPGTSIAENPMDMKNKILHFPDWGLFHWSPKERITSNNDPIFQNKRQTPTLDLKHPLLLAIHALQTLVTINKILWTLVCETIFGRN